MKFQPRQISHLYELALQNFQPNCPECESIKARMEKHLGEKEVKRIKRLIKKRPYKEIVQIIESMSTNSAEELKLLSEILSEGNSDLISRTHLINLIQTK